MALTQNIKTLNRLMMEHGQDSSMSAKKTVWKIKGLDRRLGDYKGSPSQISALTNALKNNPMTYDIPYQNLSLSIPSIGESYRDGEQIWTRQGNQLLNASVEQIGYKYASTFTDAQIRTMLQLPSNQFEGLDLSKLATENQNASIAYRLGRQVLKDQYGVDFESLPTVSSSTVADWYTAFRGIPGFSMGALTDYSLLKNVSTPTQSNEVITASISPTNPQGADYTSNLTGSLYQSPSIQETLAGAGATPEQIQGITSAPQVPAYSPSGVQVGTAPVVSQQMAGVPQPQPITPVAQATPTPTITPTATPAQFGEQTTAQREAAYTAAGVPMPAATGQEQVPPELLAQATAAIKAGQEAVAQAQQYISGQGITPATQPSITPTPTPTPGQQTPQQLAATLAATGGTTPSTPTYAPGTPTSQIGKTPAGNTASSIMSSIPDLPTAQSVLDAVMNSEEFKLAQDKLGLKVMTAKDEAKLAHSIAESKYADMVTTLENDLAKNGLAFSGIRAEQVAGLANDLAANKLGIDIKLADALLSANLDLRTAILKEASNVIADAQKDKDEAVAQLNKLGMAVIGDTFIPIPNIREVNGGLIDTTTGKWLVEPEEEETWSEPYSLGGDIVQKSSTTGEIRTAVNVASGSSGTAPTMTERNAIKIGEYTNAFAPEATWNGITILGKDGFIDPRVWKAAISDAQTNGIDRKTFIESFGYLLNNTKTSTLLEYGLTEAERALLKE